jgi:hypothetical protein
VILFQAFLSIQTRPWSPSDGVTQRNGRSEKGLDKVQNVQRLAGIDSQRLLRGNEEGSDDEDQQEQEGNVLPFHLSFTSYTFETTYETTKILNIIDF